MVIYYKRDFLEMGKKQTNTYAVANFKESPMAKYSLMLQKWVL
jgi:hypothetical protein